MRPMLSLILAPFAALSLAVPALALDPTGVWTPDNRESRYEITYCGEGEETLCAELIWIREDVQDERNMRYLNEYIFQDARQTEPDVWEGTVSIEGFDVGGTLRQTGEDAMELRACALFVICETIALNRME